MQAFLADLALVDVETFNKGEQGHCLNNAFVMNENDELTHLSVNAEKTVDFSDIVNNPTLTKLHYCDQNLTELPATIDQLTQLQTLNLQDNQLVVLPLSIDKLTKLNKLDLSGNPINNHIGVINKTLTALALVRYLLSIQAGTTPLNEAKLLVVGDERVGKTSLIKRITNQPYNVDEQSTLGIDIDKYHLSNGIQANIWDFAGQEITHQTHQFFFSGHSLYLYVLDAQKEDSDGNIFHWLSTIKAIGDNSPIIIAINKRDLNSGYTFDTNRYKGEFNIVDVLYLSAAIEASLDEDINNKTAQSIADLTRSIEFNITALQDIRFPLPLSWLKVKEDLEDRSTNGLDFFESDEYERLCQQHFIHDADSQTTLLNILNQIGIVVTYRNNRRLSAMQIINPTWVTYGVYKILRSGLIDDSAQLKLDHLAEIFSDEKKYKPRHYTWLMDLLNQFELSFSVDDATILIPSRLHPNQPDIDFDHYHQGLNFRYSYRYMLKKSVISQFIVKMRTYISTVNPVSYWQRGVFLQNGDSQAVVIADEQKKIITIAINNNTPAAKELLIITRHTLNNINESQFGAQEQVPLMLDGQVIGYESYAYLIECEREGDSSLRLKIDTENKTTHRFVISELLDDYRITENARVDNKTIALKEQDNSYTGRPSIGKRFNTSGPIKPNEHYHIDPLSRVDWQEIQLLIAQSEYFVLHAPRQTGKTSTMLAMMQALNQSAQYTALYVNIEAGQAARNDVDRGMQIVCKAIADQARDQGISTKLQSIFQSQFAQNVSGAALSDLLAQWASASDKPCILFLDEVDALVGDTLISLLRQIRAGYAQRPTAFPKCIVLCGVRDVRDYRIHSGGEVITGGSAFNIKSESLRMGNFSEDEVRTLYQTHTEETGQTFDPEIFDALWLDTRGQPWLVNALARQMTDKAKENRDRSKTLALEDYLAARERLIYERTTHLDQLGDKLKEARVRSVIAPFLEGKAQHQMNPDDVDYVVDIGLLYRAKNGALTIANRIYQEIIPRELSWGSQMVIEQQQAWYIDDRNYINMPKLLAAFQQFFRENADVWLERFDYKEAAPQLLMQAFLQRVINGGGRINREYALGRKRTDLIVEWPTSDEGFHGHVQRIVIELKILYGKLDKCIEKGLVQTAEYADTVGASQAHLVIFNREPKVSWQDKIWDRQQSYHKRIIGVWGC